VCTGGLLGSIPLHHYVLEQNLKLADTRLNYSPGQSSEHTFFFFFPLEVALPEEEEAAPNLHITQYFAFLGGRNLLFVDHWGSDITPGHRY